VTAPTLNEPMLHKVIIESKWEPGTCTFCLAEDDLMLPYPKRPGACGDCMAKICVITAVAGVMEKQATRISEFLQVIEDYVAEELAKIDGADPS